jgi:CubicO group peptidase (beta-lactamase class C family)
MKSELTPQRTAPPAMLTSLLALVLVLTAGCERPGAGAPGGEHAAAAADEAGGQNGLDEDGIDAAVPPSPRRPAPRPLGLDSTLIAEALEVAAGQSRLHNMIVARHGDVIAERHFRGPPPDRPVNVKSVSKSLLAAVTGYAIEEGYLEGMHVPVLPFFPEYAPAGEEGRYDAITLEHLLSMSSGLESTSFGNYGAWVVSRDWVRSALNRPMNFEPGTRMLYSTGNSHLTSALLTRATGRSTLALAREALGEPLGIQLPAWPTDPQGIYFGGNDMLISARGLFRFGEMYRNGGVHEGVRVLPRRWIDESWRVRVRSRRDGSGYGLGWYTRESSGYDLWFAWGYGGQFLFVVPELELTVVFTSDPWERERGHNQVLHGLIDRFIVPAATL